MSQVKIKLKLPPDSLPHAERGDSTRNLKLYEGTAVQVIERMYIDSEHFKIAVKTGQFVSKGDVLGTSGLFKYKVILAGNSGIIDINNKFISILGKKTLYSRVINIDGKVEKVVANRFVQINARVEKIEGIYYKSLKSKLTSLIYIDNKKDIGRITAKLNPEVTLFLNDNVFVEEIAKLIALGVKRLVVNGVFVDNLFDLKREINKLDGICILSGFGEFLSQKLHIIEPTMDLFWGKKTLRSSDKIKNVQDRVFEHPFWGLAGKVVVKDNFRGELNYKKEKFEFYLKNLD